MSHHMSASARPILPNVPRRSILSELPAPPGVYRSARKLARRWVYYALGLDRRLLGIHRPARYETDEQVVATLRELTRETTVPFRMLVNRDAIIAAGLDPLLHRPLSLPGPMGAAGVALVRVLPLRARR